MIPRLVGRIFAASAILLGLSSAASGWLSPVTSAGVAFLSLAAIAIYPWRKP